MADSNGALPRTSNGACSASEGRKVSTSDIQLVQNLIERCLQQYMPQREVVRTLQQQAKIDPSFTALVWQKLEEQNPDFFRAYYLRLKLKDQIVMFNYLLEQQVQVLQKLQRAWMQAMPSMIPRPGMPLPPMPPIPPGLPLASQPAGMALVSQPLPQLPMQLMHMQPMQPQMMMMNGQLAGPLPTQMNAQFFPQPAALQAVSQPVPQPPMMPLQQPAAPQQPPMIPSVSAAVTAPLPPAPVLQPSATPNVSMDMLPAPDTLPISGSGGMDMLLNSLIPSSSLPLSTPSSLGLGLDPVQLDLPILPKSFSFSDFAALDLPSNMDTDADAAFLGLQTGNMGELPRNFSFSDMALGDLDLEKS